MWTSVFHSALFSFLKLNFFVKILPLRGSYYHCFQHIILLINTFEVIKLDFIWLFYFFIKTSQPILIFPTLLLLP